MKRKDPSRFFKIIFITTLLLAYYDLEAKPEWVYAIWVEDPTSTFVIRWNSLEGDRELRYRKEAEKAWKSVVAEEEVLFSEKIVLYNAQLAQLEENTVYQFQIGNGTHTYKCKTLPKTLTNLRFVVGGDLYRSLSLMRNMHRQVAKLDPEFVVLGGDIGYTRLNRLSVHNKKQEAERWYTFFEYWEKHMVRSDGTLIPFMTVLGNHDLTSTDDRYFTAFFRDAKTLSYQAVDIGEYLSLFLLDTGHIAPVEGEQEEWLKENLQKRAAVPNKIAVYHIAAYPSVYRFKGTMPKKIREFWCPLFEKYGVQIAFEHHNHCYKRSFRIKNEKIDPTGVLYMGDGGWGIPIRSPSKPKDLWYLQKCTPINSVFLVSLDKQGFFLESINSNGDVFDTVAVKTAQP